MKLSKELNRLDSIDTTKKLDEILEVISVTFDELMGLTATELKAIARHLGGLTSSPP